MKQGLLPVVGAGDYCIISDAAYSECAHGICEFSQYRDTIQYKDWIIFFNQQGAISSLRNDVSQQWHSQNSGSLFLELTSNDRITLPVQATEPCFVAVDLALVLDYIIERIPAFKTR